MVDREAVPLGVDGRSDLNGLHSPKPDGEVTFYAFDMLVSEGDDIRKLPLSMRKTNLARLLARRVDGTHLAPFEQGKIGPDLFGVPACSDWRAGSTAPAIGTLDQDGEPETPRVRWGDGAVLAQPRTTPLQSNMLTGRRWLTY